MKRRNALRAGAIALALAAGLLPAAPAVAHHDGTQGAGPHAVHYGDGCEANSLPRNDDGSTGRIQLASETVFPQGLNFFGRSYSSLFVNNNGNVTFDEALGTFTPFPLADATNQIPMIAPFFGDVDTRAPSPTSCSTA